MGMLSFPKGAGETLLDLDANPELAGNERALEQAIADYIKGQQLPAETISVAFDAASATVTVTGSVPDQATREKIMLSCGNVQGVAHVTERIAVAAPATAARMYTVQRGDSLSQIAAQCYGDARLYRRVLDANRPMLTDPERIYPGQVLRIPA
jgi:nucleoid-associated protein YgaU